jgi:hypothetical protein
MTIEKLQRKNAYLRREIASLHLEIEEFKKLVKKR